MPANGQPDPRAPLGGAALLVALQPLARQLEEDLLARARGSGAVLRGLEERWQNEKAAHRTAEPFDLWQRAFVEQVAAAWILSCVFVRTLEDRRLLAQNRLAGPGAMDAQKAFFDFAPSLSERDYLLLTFRELSHLPAARDLFDARHNPVWMLGPSVDGARALLAFFRTPDADAPAFRFGGSDTRFLGDLYQDLSEDVRKRYALLQTPHFIESYILDRTLDRAIARFGLADTTLIDPTCGSGHFLLGAFQRLFDAFLRAEPGLDPRQAAQKALDRVAGSDINAYAVAIARFRLTLAFVEAGRYTRLADVPSPTLHLAVADSLLHGNDGSVQRTIDQVGGVTAEEIWGHVYAIEDEAAVRDVLGRRYTAVVGNPPYITVKDAALRSEYKQLYRSCYREYSLAAPFAERFFQLAKPGGAVGMITSNSFMKREFGRMLIEEVLPGLNLDGIANTSGAYIPGHGTPTVLLFGTSEPPQGGTVLCVLAKRGEPSTPPDPEQGLVWRTIADHGHQVGFDNAYASVTNVSRETLSHHPWSLGGGGAAELKELLEDRASNRLASVVDSIGFSVITGEDNALVGPLEHLTRQGLAAGHVRRLVVGDEIRDWNISDGDHCVWPNNPAGLRLTAPDIRDAVRYLWPYRTHLRARKAFGVPVEERNIPWWALREVYHARMTTPLTIAFAFIATHNHFVLDHGGRVFNRSAPIIKLPASATEDDHLTLLAYLNSSTACFWMKQVSQNKGSGTDTGKWQDDPAKIAFEFTGTQLAHLPLPVLPPSLLSLARRCDSVANKLYTLSADVVRASDPIGARTSASATREALEADLVGAQEEIDWLVYSLFGLATSTSEPSSTPLGCRPFELAAARAGRERGLDGTLLAETIPSHWPSAKRATWQVRLDAIAANHHIGLIEDEQYKRRWRTTPKDMGGRVSTFDDQLRHLLPVEFAKALEVVLRAATMPASRRALVAKVAHDARVTSLLGLARELGMVAEGLLDRVLAEDSAAFLAAYRYTDAGMEKHAEWERTWHLQRCEDASQEVGAIPVPPRYAQGDFREAHYWRLRGKLDVPKERFISYPGCEGEDGEPRYGWAGWDHKQRAQALMTLYHERKTVDGWPKERLVAMLAGLRELLPWLRQWHADVDPEYGGPMSEYYGGLYETERAALGVTDADVAAWRPSTHARRRPRRSASSG